MSTDEITSAACPGTADTGELADSDEDSEQGSEEEMVWWSSWGDVDDIGWEDAVDWGGESPSDSPLPGQEYEGEF